MNCTDVQYTWCAQQGKSVGGSRRDAHLQPLPCPTWYCTVLTSVNISRTIDEYRLRRPSFWLVTSDRVCWCWCPWVLQDLRCSSMLSHSPTPTLHLTVLQLVVSNLFHTARHKDVQSIILLSLVAIFYLYRWSPATNCQLRGWENRKKATDTNSKPWLSL